MMTGPCPFRYVEQTQPAVLYAAIRNGLPICFHQTIIRSTDPHLYVFSGPDRVSGDTCRSIENNGWFTKKKKQTGAPDRSPGVKGA